MTWKDFQELLELLSELRSKIAILAVLFPSGILVSTEG